MCMRAIACLIEAVNLGAGNLCSKERSGRGTKTTIRFLSSEPYVLFLNSESETVIRAGDPRRYPHELEIIVIIRNCR